jgi:histidine triad (HIT) family protein
MAGCIFCRIASGEIPAKIEFQDDRAVAFQDTSPKSPVHVLVIPRRHIESLNDELEDEGLLGHLLAVGARIARDKGIDGKGYRTVINTGAEAGQSVFHLHVHVMGGRTMLWPPG